jgi:hypothetical protein
MDWTAVEISRDKIHVSIRYVRTVLALNYVKFISIAPNQPGKYIYLNLCNTIRKRFAIGIFFMPTYSLVQLASHRSYSPN